MSNFWTTGPFKEKKASEVTQLANLTTPELFDVQLKTLVPLQLLFNPASQQGTESAIERK